MHNRIEEETKEQKQVRLDALAEGHDFNKLTPQQVEEMRELIRQVDQTALELSEKFSTVYEMLTADPEAPASLVWMMNLVGLKLKATVLFQPSTISFEVIEKINLLKKPLMLTQTFRPLKYNTPIRELLDLTKKGKDLLDRIESYKKLTEVKPQTN